MKSSIALSAWAALVAVSGSQVAEPYVWMNLLNQKIPTTFAAVRIYKTIYETTSF